MIERAQTSTAAPAALLSGFTLAAALLAGLGVLNALAGSDWTRTVDELMVSASMVLCARGLSKHSDLELRIGYEVLVGGLLVGVVSWPF